MAQSCVTEFVFEIRFNVGTTRLFAEPELCKSLFEKNERPTLTTELLIHTQSGSAKRNIIKLREDRNSTFDKYVKSKS